MGRKTPAGCLWACMTLCVLLLACGGGGDGLTDGDAIPADFDDAKASRFMSRGGAFEVEFRSLPDSGPVLGDNRVELLLIATDPEQAVEGLELQMVPFMPTMGHGSGVAPKVTERGGGRYQFYPVRLSMPGEWELRTTLDTEPEDYVAPGFVVR